ncbi:phosphatase PAP2 family protein [Phyllobacterium lublinensis]|uniref:phosphatase PAP2 family protein n=1 Tax=Phyllobacterium lublinensis TaxID=2875708 RepID=UPI001CCF1961|nr:phosphatase PAP2 family protein [Phyllobacterium sp. 2063]MBZ9654750.1 phosphatase PAP2 family protein [Phyllobacterium sp. 2063]
MKSDVQTFYKVAIIIGILAIDAIWIALTDFHLEGQGVLRVFAVTAFFGIVAVIYRVWRPMQAFELVCAETAILLSFTAAAAILSYLVTSLDRPLIDAQLVTLDAALGFDWSAYVGYVSERPLLGLLCSVIYLTTLAQVALAVIVLGLAGRTERTQQFVTAVMLGALACIIVSGILPSAGALATIRPVDSFWGSHHPVVDLDYKQTFFDLRTGGERLVSLDSMKGLIAFPSYHGTLSTLLILAFFRVGWWFGPILTLNVLILLATPVEGGHHLVDVIGGVAVAGGSWYIAGWLYRPRAIQRSKTLIELPV